MSDYTEYLTPERLAVEDESWGRTRHYARNGQAVIDMLERLDAPVDVVEFGAGTGWLARFVMRNAEGLIMNYTALDKHPDEVALARERIGPIGGFAIETDIRDWNPSGKLSELTCAFAFLKHFSEQEWGTILRKILRCASRICLFELNVSHVGEYLDTGPVEDGVRQFPCLSVPNDAVLEIVRSEGFELIERTVMASGPQGWEVLFVCERS